MHSQQEQRRGGEKVIRTAVFVVETFILPNIQTHF